MARTALPSSPGPAPALAWFRQDLRLGDNPALDAAVRSGRPLVLAYVLDDETPGAWKPGGASRWWLHHALAALEEALRGCGAQLVLRRGPDAILGLAAEIGAAAVYWNRLLEPVAAERDARIAAALRARGVAAHSFNGALLADPAALRTGAGAPYKVFTPFWRACRARGLPRAPLAAPKRINAYQGALASDRLADWGLMPARPDWAGGLRAAWRPGEESAQARLAAFAESTLADYAAERDRPGADASSRLSPHLHFGELSPVQVWAAVEHAPHAETFLRQIGWREFCHHLLHHWPTLPQENWRAAFDAFPWRSDREALRAWRRGRTGYPIVDAALRELWTSGHVHNRARMIAASFLVKHLLIDWREGARWFWDTLVDADLANNAASWQWVAGAGADAAPYFRIFNPVAQGERFDGDGAYVRRWVPELARLPDRWLHRPWEAPESERAAARVRLGRDYPFPIVDHRQARARALSAYAALARTP